VVVGSELVNISGTNAEQSDKIVPEVTALLSAMRKAMDQGRASDAA